jgi:hypothetical protein
MTTPPRPPSCTVGRPLRDRVEQCIARGQPTTRILVELGISYAEYRYVAARLDRIAYRDERPDPP